MNADYLTKDERAELMQWYRNNHMQRYHYMNAAIDADIACNLEDFYSYKTWIARYALMHDECSRYYHVFWIDEDATTYSRTTTKQLIRWVREKADMIPLSLYDIRRMQTHTRHNFKYSKPIRDPHTGYILYNDIYIMVYGTLEDAVNSYGYNLSSACNAGLSL